MQHLLCPPAMSHIYGIDMHTYVILFYFFPYKVRVNCRYAFPLLYAVCKVNAFLQCDKIQISLRFTLMTCFLLVTVHCSVKNLGDLRTCHDWQVLMPCIE